MKRAKSLMSLCGFAAATLFSTGALGEESTIDHSRPASPDTVDPPPERPHPAVGLGIEADVVPFILSGAHVDGWVGWRGWRARAIAVTFTAPSFFNPSGFDNIHTTIFEMELDRFFGPHANEFRGPWIAAGGGYELLTADASGVVGHGSTSGFELSTGVGWAIPVAFNAYVDPWVGAAYAFMPMSIPVGAQQMQTPRLNPQLGLKIGWNFVL